MDGSALSSAKTPFGDIAYVERGVGRAALFLHGFPLNGFQWRGALPRLSPYRRCIAPDFMALGYHRKSPTDKALRPIAQVAMLVSLLDSLGIDDVESRRERQRRRGSRNCSSCDIPNACARCC
jgi:hypothetical protein